jgi:hypothetical protein
VHCALLVLLPRFLFVECAPGAQLDQDEIVLGPTILGAYGKYRILGGVAQVTLGGVAQVTTQVTTTSASGATVPCTLLRNQNNKAALEVVDTTTTSTGQQELDEADTFVELWRTQKFEPTLLILERIQ